MRYYVDYDDDYDNDNDIDNDSDPCSAFGEANLVFSVSGDASLDTRDP